MRDLVIVPTWTRPEFLQACLDRLALIDHPDVEYLISMDRGFSPAVKSVAFGFQRRIGARVRIVARSHTWRGNSYNVLTSYQNAVTLPERPELVHLIEEDILVGSDYYQFAHTAHELDPDAFCVSACRNQQFEVGVEPPADDEAVWTHPSYQSLAVSFRPERLLEVVRHAKPAYYANMIGYCRSKFPGTKIPAPNAEQDGLIHRVMERNQSWMVYPAVPRAYHAGFIGYHRRGVAVAGSLQQRADRIAAMSTAELNSHALSYPDHQAIPLDAERAPVSKLIEWGVR